MGKGSIRSCEGHFPSPHPFPPATLKTFWLCDFIQIQIINKKDDKPDTDRNQDICIGLVLYGVNY